MLYGRSHPSIHPFFSACSGNRDSRVFKASFFPWLLFGDTSVFKDQQGNYVSRQEQDKVRKSHSNILFKKTLILQGPQRRIRRWRCRGPWPPVPTAWTQCVSRHQTTFCFHHSLPFSRVRLHCVLQCALIHLSAILCFPFLTSSPQLQATCWLSSPPPFNLISFSFHPRSFLSSEPFLLCSFLPFSSLLFSYLGHMEPRLWEPRSCLAVFV